MPSPKGPLRGGTIQRFNQSTIQLSRATDPHRLALISLNPSPLILSPGHRRSTGYTIQRFNNSPKQLGKKMQNGRYFKRLSVYRAGRKQGNIGGTRVIRHIT